MKRGFCCGYANALLWSGPLSITPMTIVVALTASACFCGPASAADAARGEALYQGCEDCHSIDKNDVGPMHRGVVGRVAGTVAGYAYSPALKASKLVWTEASLDKWLTNPQNLVPGTKMFFKIDNPQDRADIIEFLKERAK
jgi:cytochrome c